MDRTHGICALLAQSVTAVDRRSFDAGLKFLLSMQREDGGWRPQPDVAESTWVTSLIALLPEEAIRAVQTLNRAVAMAGGPDGQGIKLELPVPAMLLAGNKDEFPDGWPWFPGAAAWVIPTSFGILAFERQLSRRDDRKLKARVEAGREFLFARMCADGGWNHGSNHALGRDGDSYPETTGVALMALHNAPKSDRIGRAKAAARRHLATCRTAEGIAWLRMGLQAHGETRAIELRARTQDNTMDAALLAHRIGGAQSAADLK